MLALPSQQVNQNTTFKYTSKPDFQPSSFHLRSGHALELEEALGILPHEELKAFFVYKSQPK